MFKTAYRNLMDGRRQHTAPTFPETIYHSIDREEYWCSHSQAPPTDATCGMLMSTRHEKRRAAALLGHTRERECSSQSYGRAHLPNERRLLLFCPGQDQEGDRSHPHRRSDA